MKKGQTSREKWVSDGESCSMELFLGFFVFFFNRGMGEGEAKGKARCFYY